jgi:hypothetical protein
MKKIIFLGCAVSFGVTLFFGPASAETKEITFPIPELNNCSSREECRLYCDLTENIKSCSAFAENMGILTSEEVFKAEQFADRLESESGPLGCKTPGDCEEVCDSANNLSECVNWAKDNNLQGDNFKEAEQVEKYLKTSKKLPGGCASEEACNSYCEDWRHAEECSAFAKVVGLRTVGEVNRELVGKIVSSIKKGETPGGCTSKKECSKYCGDADHQKECTDFAVNLGLVLVGSNASKDKTDKAGGGSVSDKSFEDSIKKGAFLPDEIKKCLNDKLTEDQIKDLIRGVEPTRENKEIMEYCFSEFGGDSARKYIFPELVPQKIEAEKNLQSSFSGSMSVVANILKPFVDILFK